MENNYTNNENKTTQKQSIVGQRLARARKSRNISQNELADILGKRLGRKKYNRSTIALWEMGKNIPGDKVIEQLCDLYNVEKSYLTGEDIIETTKEFTDSLHVLNIEKLPYLDGEIVFCQNKKSEDGEEISGKWAVVDTQFHKLNFSADNHIDFTEAKEKYNLYYRPTPICYAPTECQAALNTNETKRIRTVWVEIISTNDTIRNHCDWGEYIKEENVVKLNNGIVLNMSHYGKAFVCYRQKPQISETIIFKGLAKK